MPADDVQIRLRLLGAALFSRDARRAAGDIGRIGSQADSTRGRLSMVGRGSQAVSREFSGLGTAAAAGATGIGILGAAVARMGAQTNATQDAQRVSFTALLHSRAKAAQMMKEIQQLALDSPILDPASTGDSVRMLIAYGISAQKAIPLVKSLGDMSAASGKSIAEVMPRAALALGQIEGKGKLQAQEMNQLAESVGLSRKSIRKELGLTAKEFEDTFKPGKNIKSTEAIPAIMRAMTKQSAGAADMLAKTTAGRIARGKELMSLAAGDFTRPFYDAIGKLASSAGDRLQGLQTSGKIKGFARGLFSGDRAKTRHWEDGSVGPNQKDRAQNVGASIRDTAMKIGSGAANVGKQLIDAIKPALPFVQGLLPLFRGVIEGVIGGFIAAIPVIKVVAQALGWFGTNVLKPIAPVLRIVGQAIGVVFGPAILGAVARVLGSIRFIGPVLGGALKVVLLPLRLLSGIAKAAVSGVRPIIGVFGSIAGAVGRGFTWLRRFVSFGTSMWSRIARAALNGVGSFVNVVERMVGGVRNVVGRVGSFLSRAPAAIVNGAKSLGSAIVNGIVSAIKAAPGAILNAVTSIIPDKLKGAVKKIVGSIPGLATGGVVRRGGLAVVGERGPELASLPTGTTVYDAKQTSRARPAYMKPTPTSGSAASPAPRSSAPMPQSLHVTLVAAEGGRALAHGIAQFEDLAGAFA